MPDRNPPVALFCICQLALFSHKEPLHTYVLFNGLDESPVTVESIGKAHFIWEHKMFFLLGAFIVARNITGIWGSLRLFEILPRFHDTILFLPTLSCDRWLVHPCKCLSRAPLIPPLPKCYVPIVPWTFYLPFLPVKTKGNNKNVYDYVGTNLICTLWGISCPFIWLKTCVLSSMVCYVSIRGLLISTF